MDNTKQTVLNVTGMTCASCVRHVNTALREIQGVSNVQVNLQDGKVLVEHDRSAAPTETLIAALREAGYGSTPGSMG